nr:Chain A, Major capsid protein [Bacteriophage sp.]5OAC_B Chain B, Major capsid protein [Bacteriophage sp.]5OAC_C Chain C, Major capsid protein [Bacteriophage sp.]5OAC_D Chain D, Major capsid protein [Bacteriophage sp.]5OAC_E Chain E, Major capsid protein [Bacteriophage sp.]5OAC_F Chain F, Major capsid protein [Bacteriophage sp.]5OAC_G Chain G, Major capsid protein [Bacteriophage sp.]5OAC_H Chain H, Major capsid protein [Bacteriophage sp.]5OAC_I Chain I, Major capsid protein [Bacteriophage
MTIKYLSSETEKLMNQTVSGIDVCFTLIGVDDDSFASGSKNDYISDTPKFLDPSNVHIKATLKRGGKDYVLFSENLALLAKYSTITQGRDQWEEGVKLAAKEMVHLVYIPFSGNTNWPAHINLKDNDVLEVYVNVVRGAYGAELDANACICDVRTSPSIGVEKFIPFMTSYSIRANQATDLVNLGNDVTRIALLSMTNDVSNIPNAFTDVTLSSDRLDKNFNSNQLILEHSKCIEDSVRSHANEVDSYLIHEDIEIDSAKVHLKMNPAKIRENTIYLVRSHFQTSLEILQKAVAMEEKHQSADIAKVPAT